MKIFCSRLKCNVCMEVVTTMWGRINILCSHIQLNCTFYYQHDLLLSVLLCNVHTDAHLPWELQRASLSARVCVFLILTHHLCSVPPGNRKPITHLCRKTNDDDDVTVLFLLYSFVWRRGGRRGVLACWVESAVNWEVEIVAPDTGGAVRTKSLSGNNQCDVQVLIKTPAAVAVVSMWNFLNILSLH